MYKRNAFPANSVSWFGKISLLLQKLNILVIFRDYFEPNLAENYAVGPILEDISSHCQAVNKALKSNYPLPHEVMTNVSILPEEEICPKSTKQICRGQTPSNWKKENKSDWDWFFGLDIFMHISGMINFICC